VVPLSAAGLEPHHPGMISEFGEMLDMFERDDVLQAFHFQGSYRADVGELDGLADDPGKRLPHGMGIRPPGVRVPLLSREELILRRRRQRRRLYRDRYMRLCSRPPNVGLT
jgi:hypothetical protein